MPSTGPDCPSIAVVAALIWRADRLLIARRPEDRHQGGLWEFPGGKIEAGETPWGALQRELAEELGLVLYRGECRYTVAHAYPDKHVSLQFWSVPDWSGEPEAREGQAWAWVAVPELPRYAFPEANRPVVASLLREAGVDQVSGGRSPDNSSS